MEMFRVFGKDIDRCVKTTFDESRGTSCEKQGFKADKIPWNFSDSERKLFGYLGGDFCLQCLGCNLRVQWSVCENFFQEN